MYLKSTNYTDFYDGAQIFTWKTCESWCFLTSIVNLPPAYRSNLGISTFAENYKIEVLEMICLWEALFPDDQNSFQHHQIMDIVSSIPSHGSMLYAWGELLKNTRKKLLKHPRNFLLDAKGAYIWHHKPGSGFDFQDVSKSKKGIRNVAFYRHFDLRVQVVYGRITKEQHLAAAREAREKNAKRKTVEEFKVKGFKDVWPFDRLPYSDLARNSSIPLHGSMLYAWGELLKNTRRSIPGRRQQETNAEKSKEDASWLVWNDED